MAIAAALAICGSASAQAGLLHFSFPGGAVAPSFVDPNTIGGSILDGPGAGLLTAGVSISDTACFIPGSTSVSAASAIANGDYVEFKLAPGPGLGLSLGSFTFDAARTVAAGGAGFVLRSSRDGFATNIGAVAISSVAPTLSSYNIDLSGQMYQNIPNTTTFRLYGYASGGAGSGICFDNISVNGAVVQIPPVVPEPGTALHGLAILGAAALSRRTTKRFSKNRG
jgi:hypothetical protein